MTKPGKFFKEHSEVHAFPIRAGQKHPPCFENNLNLATTNIKWLRRWYVHDYPHCNFGVSVALSGLIVLDVDTKPGKHGAASFARVCSLHDWYPRKGLTLPRHNVATLTVRTPSGGLHYYLRQTNVVRFLTGRQNIFGPDSGVDAPGYVLAPGSVLDASNDYPGDYTVIDEGDVIGGNTPIANAPDWLGIYLQEARPEAVEQVPVVELDQIGHIAFAIDYLKQATPAVQGRNGEHTLLMVAAALKDLGISRDMAVELLARYYNDRCEPQWCIGDGATADRLDVKVANAYAYLKHVQPGAMTAEALFGDDPEEFAR